MKTRLLITLYNSNKVKVIDVSDDYSMKIVEEKKFVRPMGIGLHGQSIAIGTKMGIDIFQINTDGRCILDRQIKTGVINVHDVAITADKDIIYNNTKWSKIEKISANTDEPQKIFSPFFIGEHTGKDQCHLNSLCLDEESKELVYTTAFQLIDDHTSWQKGGETHLTAGGVIDIKNNVAIVTGLGFPHSVRIYKGDIYYCNSVTGDLCKVENGKPKTIGCFYGFTRGLDFKDNVAFVGLSTTRVEPRKMKQGEERPPLPVSLKEDNYCGIVAYDLDRKMVLGSIRIGNPGMRNLPTEAYDIKVVHNKFTFKGDC